MCELKKQTKNTFLIWAFSGCCELKIPVLGMMGGEPQQDFLGFTTEGSLVDKVENCCSGELCIQLNGHFEENSLWCC